MRLQKILIELRKERGLSQKSVADAIGISQSTIAKIEVDRNEATASTLRKLSDFFGVSADYLLGRTDEYGGLVGVSSSQLSRDEEELVSLFSMLGSSRKEDIIVYARALAGVDAQPSAKKKA